MLVSLLRSNILPDVDEQVVFNRAQCVPESQTAVREAWDGGFSRRLCERLEVRVCAVGDGRCWELECFAQEELRARNAIPPVFAYPCRMYDVFRVKAEKYDLQDLGNLWECTVRSGCLHFGGDCVSRLVC